MGQSVTDDSQLEQFIYSCTRVRYWFLAGLKADCDLKPLFARYSHLYEPQAVRNARHAFNNEVDPVAKRRLQLRLLELAQLHLANPELEDRLATSLSSQVVTDGCKHLSWNQLVWAIRNTKEPDHRRSLAKSYMQVTTQFEQLIEQLWAWRIQRVRELGYRSYVDAYSAWKGIPVQRTLAVAHQMLEATDNFYYTTLDTYAQKCGVSSGIDYANMQWILRGEEWDRWFSPTDMLPMLVRISNYFLSGVTQPSNLKIDLQPRDRKAPRPFCAALNAPSEVILVMQPTAGYSQYSEALHELGHALHFCCTDASLPFEFREILDDAICETYAFLFSSMMQSTEFLREHIHIPREVAQAFVKYARFMELYTVRRYCAKTILELRAFSGVGLSRFYELHDELMFRAVGYNVPAAVTLIDFDGGLYASQYLLAWILRARLNDQFLRKHCEEWLESKAARDELKRLWSSGQQPKLHEIIADQGDHLDPSYLVAQLMA